MAGLNLDIAYWFLTVMCELTKTKKAKNTNDQNRSNKQLSTLINSRRKGKQAEKPTFGNLLLCYCVEIKNNRRLWTLIFKFI